MAGGALSGLGNAGYGLASGVQNTGLLNKNIGYTPTPDNMIRKDANGLMSGAINMSVKNQIPNQRNQYYPSQQPANYMTQYGAQSAQTSQFIPITSDFSQFAK